MSTTLHSHFSPFATKTSPGTSTMARSTDTQSSRLPSHATMPIGRPALLVESPESVVQDGKTGALLKGELPAPLQGKHHYILCMDPFDSEASLQALDYTQKRLAQPGDLVVLVTVLELFEEYNSFPVDGYIGITPLDYYDEEKLKRRRIACQNKAVDHLAKLSEGFANSIEVHVRVSYGEVLEAIVEAARFHKADMVITGRRKHEKLLKRLFSPGSVSSALLTNTDLSVLVIR